MVAENPIVSEQAVPMTPDAFHRLRAAVARLEARLSFGGADASTIHSGLERLKAMRRAMSRAALVQPDGSVVVGSRVTVQWQDGLREVYELVGPGEADIRARRLSPDAPIGAALLGRRTGDDVEVAVPAGQELVKIVNVEY